MQKLFQIATNLQNSVVTHVTSSEKMTNEDYQQKREAIVQNPSLRSFIPEFVIKYRSIDQVEKYFLSTYATYAERRESIWSAFSELLNFLEFGEASVQENNPTKKVFISYSVIDKEYAGKIKNILNYVGLESFLAHEDIDVSHEWADKILEEINQSAIFICLLSKNFLDSDYCLQETGIAASREDVCIIPLSLDGSIPPGFLKKIQSSKIDPERPKIEDLLPAFIKYDKKLANKVLIETIKSAPNYRSAEIYCQLIKPILDELSDDEAAVLIEACKENGQVYDAVGCAQTFFPLLRQKFKHLIGAEADRLFVKKISQYGGKIN
jgi:TIR domain